MSSNVPAPGAAHERLRRIEAVTESALAHLDVPKLLDELLVRVRELLEVDTAAILLLDPSASYLVAVAAKGLEEEVRQGVRIPLGAGFAGQIAAEKQPVAIEHINHRNVLNPILRQKGVHSLLGVPLLVSGTVIGVLHVGTLSPHRFNSDDIQLLQLVADRVALATSSRISHEERTAATVLQRSLLPPELPKVAGLDLAARYVPGEGEVGGDWYDVFVLPSGWLCILVGDVVGRGLSSAIAMGRLRCVARAYAMDCIDPAHLLGKLDRQVCHFESDVMVTVLCAMAPPECGKIMLSSAGHPPPVLAEPGQMTTAVDLPVDLPLGIDANRQRRSTTVPLPPGSSMCFYTDGLVERRNACLDDGIEQLRAAVRAEPAETVCASAMASLVGSGPTLDDIALLVVHRNER